MRMTLMQKLIMWQQEQSQKEHLEPYMVLQFNTIKEIVRLEPKTHDALIRIKGIGPAKVRKYGDALLRIVRGNSVVGNEQQASNDLFSEASIVNEAVLTSKRPPSQNVQCDPETGEIVESDKKDTAVTVTEFVTMLDTMLRTHFRSIRVQGEIVGFKRNANGHAYFEIKDRESILRCAVFRSQYDLSGIALEDGMEIIVTGYPNYHKKYGFSFVGDTVELYGEGALKKAYDELKKKLEREGLFAIEKKRDVPKMPKKIGLITSRTGAAIGDFMSNVGQYGYKILFHHTSVEGAYALNDIKRALETMAKKDIDVLVVVRGGGSLESLQAFNNETIIRMIADFPVPVVVGVGHEEDETIATLVADVGASTPTGAARAVRESWDMYEKKLSSYQSHLMNTCDAIIKSRSEVLRFAQRDLIDQLEIIIDHFSAVLQKFMFAVNKITAGIAYQKLHIKNHTEKMINRVDRMLMDVHGDLDLSPVIHSCERVIKDQIRQLDTDERTLMQNDPVRQLSLGYSIARDDKNRIIRSQEDVNDGENMTVQVHDGTIASRVVK
jgi:exodeoxyribonuclease VII large subunit